MPTVTLYSRHGCHLCEDVCQLIERARRAVPFQFDILDIDADPVLKARYDWEVPVVAINGRDLFNYAIDYDAFVQMIKETD